MTELNLLESFGIKLLLAFAIVLALFVYFDKNSVLNGNTPEENKKEHYYYSERSDLDLNPKKPVEREGEDKKELPKATATTTSSTKSVKQVRKRKT